MQSRLAITARRSASFFSSQALRRGLASATDKRTADPAVHAVDYGDDPALFPMKPEESTQSVAEPKPAKQQTDDPENYSRPRNNTSGTDPLAPPRPPHAPSSRLESTGVNQPLDPTLQQKRSHGSSTSTPAIEDVSCAGLDGTPWPEEKEENVGDTEQQQEDDKDYFKHHKASPLSEIRVADTRKPITQAMHGTTADYGMGKDVIGWRPEQLDTADEALRRATKIFTMNAMRAVPDSDAPHSRVLRCLRGENF